MSDIAIKFENISKQYHLGKIGTGTLSHDLNRWWTMNIRGKEDPYLKIGQVNDRATKAEGDYVWALKDINFEVKQGEVLGIIGKNGAGKSTLLKILSRVTNPTTGRITASGRIASLLEVGTGFHPEMTGRENIFMNGAIMGMSKAEITRKFDEIVDFSGVEKYIDTPTKRYSSGMTVRLGFAIAAHLEPEILVVDEVLAVGDAEFQKKAIGKMQDVSRGEGRTVLFVSHNMQAISTLTNRCIILDKGEVIYDGITSEGIDKYLFNKITSNPVFESKPMKNPNITKVEVLTSNENQVHICGEPLEVKIEINVPYPIKGASLSFQIVNTHDTPIVHLWTFDSERMMCRETGLWEIICSIPRSRLYLGEYSLSLYFSGPPGGDKFDHLEGVCPFKVEMYTIKREFEFKPNTCTYIEDATWKINRKENE